jgi:hypothetical protein
MLVLPVAVVVDVGSEVVAIVTIRVNVSVVDVDVVFVLVATAAETAAENSPVPRVTVPRPPPVRSRR